MNKKIIKILVTSVILFFAVCVSSSFADSIDQSETFNVDSKYDYYKRTQLVATVQHVSDQAYFYIEDKWWNSLNSYKRNQAIEALKDMGNEFDNIIYPKLTDSLGDVWNPGIDNDSRITILITELIDSIGGYFNTCHEYSSSQCKTSNEREMIHANVEFLFGVKMKAFIAHEMQHLISWNQKERLNNLNEDIWINEMRSEYVPSLLDYNTPYSGSLLEARVKSFLNNSRDPLGEWKNQAGDYGVIALFGQYLANQFGENIFSLISKNEWRGIISINKALEESGYSEGFDEVFNNWTLTNYYNNLAMSTGGKYGYTNPNLKQFHVVPTVNRFRSYSVVSFSETVKDWSPRWYLFQNELSTQDSNIALKIQFQSSVTNSDFWIPYVINYKNGKREAGAFIDLKNQNGIAYVFNFAKDVESVLVVPANHSKRAHFTSNDSSVRFILKASTVIINQPVISSVFPSKGSIYGENAVVIKGGNFKQGIEVYFGGIKSSNVNFINETELNVIVPAHIIGKVNVWIKNPDEESSVFAQGYEYINPPVINGSLIRAKGDYRVYIVQNGYKRHILDGRIFDFYGHLNWENIIEVTAEERDSYQSSAWFRADGDKKVYEVNEDKTKHWLNMTAEQFYSTGRRWEGVFIINNRERDFYRTSSDVRFE